MIGLGGYLPDDRILTFALAGREVNNMAVGDNTVVQVLFDNPNNQTQSYAYLAPRGIRTPKLGESVVTPPPGVYGSFGRKRGVATVTGYGRQGYTGALKRLVGIVEEGVPEPKRAFLEDERGTQVLELMTPGFQDKVEGILDSIVRRLDRAGI